MFRGLMKLAQGHMVYFLRLFYLQEQKNQLKLNQENLLSQPTSPEVHLLWTQFSPEDPDISRATALCDFSQLWLLSPLVIIKVAVGSCQVYFTSRWKE